MDTNFNPPLSLQDLVEMQYESERELKTVKTKAAKFEKVRAGNHWNDDEKFKIESQNRVAYSINLINHKINTILSSQRIRRSVYKVNAISDPADEYKAHIATLLLREKERRNNLKYLESEIFESGLAVSFGAVEVYPEEILGSTTVKLRKLDYKNTNWDPNSKSYNLEDASFISYKTYLRRYEIEKMFSTKLNSEALNQNLSLEVMVNFTGNADFDIIPVTTHYQKANRSIYIVIANDYLNLAGLNGNPVAGKFLSKTDAEKKLREIYSKYILENLEKPYAEVVESNEIGVDRYIYTPAGLLNYEQTPLQKIPVSIYRSFFFEGKFWTLSDLLIDPQLFLNRIFMQIDYSFGRDVKNVFQGNINALAESETPQTAQFKAEKTGGIIWTRTGEDAFRPLKLSGVNPQYFQVAGIMQSFIEDISGGRSFQGLSESSAESGKAILAKQRQGSLTASLFLDNLARWKKDLGEKILENINCYESLNRKLTLLGDELSAKAIEFLTNSGIANVVEGSRYLQINGDVLGSEGIEINNFDFELTVSETPYSDTEKSETLTNLLEFAKLYPGVIPPEVMLEYFDIKLKNGGESGKNSANPL